MFQLPLAIVYIGSRLMPPVFELTAQRLLLALLPACLSCFLLTTIMRRRMLLKTKGNAYAR